VITYTPTVASESAGLLRRSADRVLSVLSIEKTCDTCGGDGSVAETRERHLEELTSTQMSFLYEAQYERKKAENGGEEVEEEVEQAQQQIPNNIPSSAPSGGAPPGSSGTPPGSPPAKGNVHQF